MASGYNAEANQKKQSLLVILGPTAVGKTAFSVELAAKLGAEIISGDSMQFYRYMDIGTAKITPEEMLSKDGKLIRHHLLDIVNPDNPMSVADFQAKAMAKIAEIAERGNLPMVVGGTGLYLSALVDGYDLAAAPAGDEAVRARLHEEYHKLGRDVLHQRLLAADAKSAAQISPNDEKRLVRALEVLEVTGKPISQQGKAANSPFDAVLLGLIREREEIYQRIEQRVDIMLKDGLLDEVWRLNDLGFGADCKPMQGLGYRQVCQYFDGFLTYDEMVRLIKRDTRRFAKRQLTWWRRDERILWQRADVPLAQMLDGVLPECRRL